MATEIYLLNIHKRKTYTRYKDHSGCPLIGFIIGDIFNNENETYIINSDKSNILNMFFLNIEVMESDIDVTPIYNSS